MALVYDEPLRFGLFFAPFHSAQLNPTYAFERDLLLTEHLDRLGFEEIWYGEHHSGAMEMVAAPELMIAAAAQRTKYIRLGTGVKSLPYYNPFMVAETMAQLDHMTRGRAMFGVGPGALPSDATMIGIPVAELRSRMEESLDVIVALMKGETVTRKSSWFDLHKAQLSVGCFTRPMMEMAVTVIRSPAGVVAAAQARPRPLNARADERRHPRSSRRQLGHLRDREPQTRPHAGSQQMAHHADDAYRRDAREGLCRCGMGFSRIQRLSHDIVPAPPAIPRDTDDLVAAAIEKQVAVIGTPDDAIREIERVRQKLGGFGAVLLFGNDLAPWPAQHAQLRADRRIREAAFQQSERAARRELQSDGGGHQRVPPSRRRRLGRGDRCV